MNSVSVTGKNWILKKFDQEKIIYLKDNFSLDEITAKLLVLRNIKKEDINSFLNPSIKNFLFPTTVPFLRSLQSICLQIHIYSEKFYPYS